MLPIIRTGQNESVVPLFKMKIETEDNTQVNKPNAIRIVRQLPSVSPGEVVALARFRITTASMESVAATKKKAT